MADETTIPGHEDAASAKNAEVAQEAAPEEETSEEEAPKTEDEAE